PTELTTLRERRAFYRINFGCQSPVTLFIAAPCRSLKNPSKTPVRRGAPQKDATPPTAKTAMPSTGTMGALFRRLDRHGNLQGIQLRIRPPPAQRTGGPQVRPPPWPLLPGDPVRRWGARGNQRLADGFRRYQDGVQAHPGAPRPPFSQRHRRPRKPHQRKHRPLDLAGTETRPPRPEPGDDPRDLHQRLRLQRRLTPQDTSRVPPEALLSQAACNTRSSMPRTRGRGTSTRSASGPSTMRRSTWLCSRCPLSSCPRAPRADNSPGRRAGNGPMPTTMTPQHRRASTSPRTTSRARWAPAPPSLSTLTRRTPERPGRPGWRLPGR